MTMKKFVVLLPDELHEYLQKQMESNLVFESPSQYLRYLVKKDKEEKERDERNETQ